MKTAPTPWAGRPAAPSGAGTVGYGQEASAMHPSWGQGTKLSLSLFQQDTWLWVQTARGGSQPSLQTPSPLPHSPASYIGAAPLSFSLALFLRPIFFSSSVLHPLPPFVSLLAARLCLRIPRGHEPLAPAV